MQSKAGLFLLFLSFLITSHCSNGTNKEYQCADLTKQLHHCLTSYLKSKGKNDLHKMDSLLILTQGCDQTNSQLAWIKIDVALAKGDLDLAMANIRFFERSYEGPDLSLKKGQVFEMMQHVDSAKNSYHDAIGGYQELQRGDSTNFSHIIGELQATKLLNGKLAAKEKLDFYRRKYPFFEKELDISARIIDKD